VNAPFASSAYFPLHCSPLDELIDWLVGPHEGRKSYAELNPTLVREARRLRRKNPKSGKRKSLQRVAKELAEGGFLNGRGNPPLTPTDRTLSSFLVVILAV